MISVLLWISATYGEYVWTGSEWKWKDPATDQIEYENDTELVDQYDEDYYPNFESNHPVNCSLSSWSEWSSFKKNCPIKNCDQGCVIRVRTVEVKEKYGGSCDEELYEFGCNQCNEYLEYHECSSVAKIVGLSSLISLVCAAITAVTSIYFTRRKFIKTIKKLKEDKKMFVVTKAENSVQPYEIYDNDELDEQELSDVKKENKEDSDCNVYYSDHAYYS